MLILFALLAFTSLALAVAAVTRIIVLRRFRPGTG
jgi:hypothetical protein